MSNETKIVSISDIGMYARILHLSDAKLRTDDGCTFDIHRAVLAMRSEYFQAMFCDMNKERKDFAVPGISGECLNEILCNVYTGDIRVTERNVSDLMIAADYLLLTDLFMKIKHSIKPNMTEVSCLGILQAAHHIGDENTFQESFRFVQTRFEGLVRFQKEELANLSLEVFRLLVSNRSLYVYNETTVWHAIVEWTQKDIVGRMCFVPQLLLTLAMEDIGEELATEILQHEIVSKNSLMKDFIDTRSNDFSSHLDIFLSFSRSYSNRFTQPCSHRIPPKLHVILSPTGGDDNSKCTLYSSYDENLDLWCKIIEVSFYPRFLIAVGHNIYMFSSRICGKFDLNVMDWVSTGLQDGLFPGEFRRAYSEFSVVAIDAYIYILGNKTAFGPYVMTVCDTANNSWFSGVLPPNIRYGGSVAIDKKIYIVGSDTTTRLMMHMFDPMTQQWSLLPSPIDNPYLPHFELVAYRQKIYLLADEPMAEVFDPSTNLWKELPDLPYTYITKRAVVINDQLFVCPYSDEPTENSVRWNDLTECWEKLDKDLNHYKYCCVDNVDTVRMITKQNRDPETQMEKSVFNC